MPQVKEVVSEENKNIRYGAYFAFAGGTAALIQMLLGFPLQEAFFELYLNQTMDSAVAWGNLTMFSSVLAVVIGVSYVMISLALYSGSEKINLNLSSLLSYIGFAAGIVRILSGLYIGYVGFLARDIGAEVIESLYAYIQSPITLVFTIIGLAWLITTAFAFIRMGRALNMNIGTAAGILLLGSMILSIIFPIAVNLVIGMALIFGGVTLLRISNL